MEASSVDTLARRGRATAAKRGSALFDLVSQGRDAAADASDSILAYTKKNPAKALAMSAVAGALLFVIAKANATRSD